MTAHPPPDSVRRGVRVAIGSRFQRATIWRSTTLVCGGAALAAALVITVWIGDVRMMPDGSKAITSAAGSTPDEGPADVETSSDNVSSAVGEPQRPPRLPSAVERTATARRRQAPVTSPAITASSQSIPAAQLVIPSIAIEPLADEAGASGADGELMALVIEPLEVVPLSVQ